MISAALRRKLSEALVGGLAVGLQIRRGLGPLGIKGLFSPADFLLPVALLVLAGRGERLPRLRLPGAVWWLAAITMMLVGSLLWGRLQLGQWSSWALINKLVGWGFLVGYLLVGARIGAEPAWRERFLRWGLFAVAAVAAVSVGLFLLRPLVVLQVSYVVVDAAQRLIGLQANPTSFGLLLAAFLVLQLPAFGRGEVLSSRQHWLVAGILLLAILLTGSRSVWIGLALALGVLGALGHIRLRVAIRVGLGGMALAVLAVGVLYLRNPHALVYVIDPSILRFEDFGAEDRRQQFAHAWAMFVGHPVLGGGIGRFFEEQRSLGLANPQTIHNTALWLLAETGMVGFAVVACFFLTVARTLWCDRADWFAAAGLAVLALFVGASIGTEVIYQRHLWLILGIALAGMPRRDGGR